MEESLRYKGPYEVLQLVGNVSYELKLPNVFASFHQVIHVLMLKKCLGDPASILTFKGLGVNENLSYEEVLDEILFLKVKQLRKKEVATINVLWRNHLVEGETWKAEAEMRSCYP